VGACVQVQNLPAHGARLREAPDEVALQFSEAVVAESVEMSARLADGRSVRLASPVVQADGKVAKAALAAKGDGVYLVSWQVVRPTTAT
jgi:methionine-rich copper-binding protein CopC